MLFTVAAIAAAAFAFKYREEIQNEFGKPTVREMRNGERVVI